jgi:GT2 family glycosyltransferase
MNEGVEVSVVIPTIGRAGPLEATLEAFGKLDPSTPPFEVVVVLDGEDGATRQTAEQPHPFAVRVLSQGRGGPGPARNLGAQAADGELIVFLNDDTKPDLRCLAAHAEAQRQLGPCVAIGRVEWDPEKPVTEYMAWLAPGGHQFNYGRLDAERPAPWDACWATNLAVPRQWVLDEPFDPDFPVVAIEDGEWGYRMALEGHPIRYLPEAVCFHDHRYAGPADFRRRARTAGTASRYVVGRHPELLWTLIGRPTVAAKVRALLMLWPGNWRREMIWDLDYRWNYVLGILHSGRVDRLH